MRQPTDVIVGHDSDWQHIPTGDVYHVVWVSPREVVAASINGAWIGRAVDFVREFVAI